MIYLYNLGRLSEDGIWVGGGGGEDWIWVDVSGFGT
jgi:hypothetical protein